MKKNSMKESNLKIGIAGYGYVGKKRRKILDNISGVNIWVRQFYYRLIDGL